MIYLRSIRHLARDIARAARRFAEDYHNVTYDAAMLRAGTDPSWSPSVVAARVGMAADLRFEVGLADEDLARLDRDLSRWEDVQ